MNKTIALYDYNVWANERILNHLKSLPVEVFSCQVGNVFPSIAIALGHIAAVDEVWFYRMKAESPLSIDTNQFNNIDEAWNYFNKLHYEVKEFLLKKEDLEAAVTYKNTRGMEFNNTISEIVQHMVNHGTYHRGNITSILRQIEYSGISTDYIEYLRTTKA